MAAVGSAAKTGPGSSIGSGSVFVPNPVQSLGDESLSDQKDSDAAVPAAAYHTVTLTNLDGSGFLRGDYANVYSSTGNLAFSPTNTFAFRRHQDEFEQVMAYYWITEAQKYIHVPHCLRRLDTNLHYPDDLDGEVHDDGRIWSRAQWDIRLAIGNVKADTIILQASFDFPGTTMTDLASRTVAAAKQLYPSKPSVAAAVQKAFADRGIL